MANSTPRKIRILVVDDHGVVRQGLRLLLSRHSDLEVVGEAADGKEAVERARDLSPDIILLDLTMPGSSGLEAARELVALSPGSRILVLTMHQDPGYLKHLLLVGAKGYILKKAVDTELVAAVRAVQAGQTYVDPSLTGALVEPYVSLQRPRGQNASGSRPLSSRETEVLSLMARGYTYQQIAEKLCVSTRTVETHRIRILDKLGLKSRADLVGYALQYGLLKED